MVLRTNSVMANANRPRGVPVTAAAYAAACSDSAETSALDFTTFHRHVRLIHMRQCNV